VPTPEPMQVPTFMSGGGRLAPEATRSVSDTSVVVQMGRRAWALIGIAVIALAALWSVVRVEFVAVPLIVALLPAAALMPLADRLRRIGVPPAVSAAVTVLALVASVTIAFVLAAPAIAGQLGALGSTVAESTARAQTWLAGRPFGIETPDVQTLAKRLSALVLGGTGATRRLLGFADVAARGVAQLLLGLVALFFYVKDGRTIAGWLNNVAPPRWRSDVARMSAIAWDVLGSYIRGQLTIAAVDGITVGVGLALLRVPLAAVLGVLVAFFALFPMVGAFVGGGLAVLVAFANGGAPLAAAVILLLIGVFQLEANLLAPLVLGRSVRLHPLGVVVALGCGAVLHGVIGALIAVPVTACGTRLAAYLRGRRLRPPVGYGGDLQASGQPDPR
jgi:predicted PurR-regulated permease PerM